MTLLEIVPQLQALERDLDLSEVGLARALDVSPRTVARWHHEGNLPQNETRRRLDELWALRQRMLELFSSREEVHEWLMAQSMYLGWFTPAEVIRIGRIDRVRADLDGLAAGVYH